MKIPLYQIDAFTSRVFAGNPAAVCPLRSWLPDATLQSIAAENNLAETAYFVGGQGEYDIRWFTPAIEIDLCGHATLASGFVVMSTLEPGRDDVRFSSKSGMLRVMRDGETYTLDFPSREPVRREAPPGLADALGSRPAEVWSSRDVMAVFESEESVRSLRPDMARLAALDAFAVIATAPGRDCDFVSRFFAPRAGIPEDPVTGSAHSTLTPFWARRLGRSRLHARQVSARGGELTCEQRGDRVLIGGQVAKYLEGTIEI
jgi:PhzF family phenazine biosynthesis protein